MSWLEGPTVVDDGSAALILQLQRDDVEAISARNKSKQREGEQTDAELALQLCLEELQLFETTYADQQMAHSIAAAVLSDSALLHEAARLETQASRDRALATRLHGTNGNAPVMPTRSTQDDESSTRCCRLKSMHDNSPICTS